MLCGQLGLSLGKKISEDRLCGTRWKQFGFNEDNRKKRIEMCGDCCAGAAAMVTLADSDFMCVIEQQRKRYQQEQQRLKVSYRIAQAGCEAHHVDGRFFSFRSASSAGKTGINRGCNVCCCDE